MAVRLSLKLEQVSGSRPLAQKIGVRAEIVKTPDVLEHLQDPEAASRGFALICSLEGARPHRGWEDDQENGKAASRLAQYLREREHDDPLLDVLE